MDIFSIGHNNFIPHNRVSLILQIGSRPTKTLISKARKLDKLIDASNGRKRKSVVITTDGFVVLSSMSPTTLVRRFIEEESYFDSN